MNVWILREAIIVNVLMVSSLMHLQKKIMMMNWINVSILMNVKNEFTNVIQVEDGLRTNGTVPLGDRTQIEKPKKDW